MVFARLHYFDPEAEERKLADNSDSEGGEMKMSMSASAPQAEQLPQSSGEQDGTDDQQPQPQNEVPPEPDEPPPETPTIPRAPCKSIQIP